MTDTDPHRIEDLASLREAIPEPKPTSALKIFDRIEEHAAAFIARSPFLVMATSDSEGHLDASPKGDGPGFVRVLDERTLAFPERRGNQLAMGLQNVLANPQVGLLFLVPGTAETLRVNGRAELTRDPELIASLVDTRGKPALLAMRVRIDEVFFHCAKAFIRSELWKPESWGDTMKVSMGRVLQKKLSLSEADVAAVDANVEESYRSRL